MKIVLISTYELGRQPFGLASPAAWLRANQHDVTCVDLAVQNLPDLQVAQADLIAFYLPMHTATRLAVKAIARVQALNSRAHLCCYGLYAPLNEPYLRGLGVNTILGGEFEGELLHLAERLSNKNDIHLAAPQSEPLIALDRLQFIPPDRTTLPALTHYASLRVNGSTKRAGYTEASRGCKHFCRHCPIVPVYNGSFGVVQRDIVLEDIRRQVSMGAEHLTFGDPDFFNGPGHAIRLAEALHREFPGITYDATIKIEHLRKHRDLLPTLKDTGCLFVISAVESIDDAILEKLNKGHTVRDFIAVVEDFRLLGLALSPTFIAFTPWTTIQGYRELLAMLVQIDLVENVSPVQLALRLLITAKSRLLELDDIQAVVERFDEVALAYRWRHDDPAVDALATAILKLVRDEEKAGSNRQTIFRKIWEAVPPEPRGKPLYEDFGVMPRATIPYMDEPWFC